MQALLRLASRGCGYRWELYESQIRENRFLPQAVEDDPNKLLLPSSSKALAPPAQHKPWHRRTERVNQVLVQAWALGFHTYKQLIEQVRYRTGMGCSKRAIARLILDLLRNAVTLS